MKKIYIDNKRKIDSFRKKRFLYDKKRKETRKTKWEINKFEKLQHYSSPSRISKDLKKLQHNVRKLNTETIKCPQNYSFINNTEEFLIHMNQAIKIGQSKKLVNFDLTGIEYLTFDSLCVLLASSREKDKFKLGVAGNLPKDPEIRRFVRKSGFLKDFSGKKSGGMFNWESDKQLSLGLSKTIIKTIEKHTFSNDKQRTQKAKIHTFLVEAMKNTDDHAGEGYNWWVFYYKDNNSITKVCLLDLGKGILKTMYNKIDFLFWDNPLNVLKMLFEGKIESPQRRTKTKEEKRGTGLPSIYKFLIGPKIQNAYAITNNVKFNISENTCEYLKTVFHGTFYYWEIHP